MKIVILGVGKVGETLVKNFIKEGHDLVAVDYDPEVIDKVVNTYDVIGLIGSGVEREVLVQSGVSEADLFIACTSHDEINILSSVLAKKLGAKKTVARVRDPMLFKEVPNIRQELGLDLAFNPERRTAFEIAQVLKFPSAKNIESFAGGKAVMIEFDVAAGNPIIGKSLIEVAAYGYKILFAMVERGEEVVIPRGDFVINEGDSIHIIATESEIAAFCKKIKTFRSRAKSVFVIGGGKIAYYLAKELEKSGIELKLVEKDPERCKTLSEELPFASVLNADGTEQSVLDEENIKGADACVSLTGMDETNVIVSLYAKQKKVDKVITKIDRENILGMVKILGLDTVVSPKNAIANYILRFVRAHQAESGEGVNTLYKLNDKVEALEFTVGESFKHTGVPLKDLKIKNGVLIGGVVRENDFILPVGDTTLAKGDRVIVVASSDRINELSDVLK